MTVEISSDVPIPGRCVSRVRYPIADLEVGQSFFISLEDSGRKSAADLQANLGSCARNVRKAHPDREFTTRKVEENGERGVRLWRIA